jgi:hypothetical protein
MSLELLDDVVNVSHIERNVDLSDLPSIIDVKAKTPIRSKDDRILDSLFTDLHFLSPFELGQHRRRKPFREWSPSG